MNGWSSHLGADRWDDEPAWIYEITWEWEPVGGQRYPGDPGRRRRAVHTPVYEASHGIDPAESATWPNGATPPDAPESRQPVPYVAPPPAVAPSAPIPPSSAPVPPSSAPVPPSFAPVPPSFPQVPPSWDRRSDAPPPPSRDEPSWNRPVPLPERLPESWAARRQPRPDEEMPDPRAAGYPPAGPAPDHHGAGPGWTGEQRAPRPPADPWAAGQRWPDADPGGAGLPQRTGRRSDAHGAGGPATPPGRPDDPRGVSAPPSQGRPQYPDAHGVPPHRLPQGGHRPGYDDPRGVPAPPVPGRPQGSPPPPAHHDPRGVSGPPAAHQPGYAEPRRVAGPQPPEHVRGVSAPPVSPGPYHGRPGHQAGVYGSPAVPRAAVPPPRQPGAEPPRPPAQSPPFDADRRQQTGPGETDRRAPVTPFQATPPVPQDVRPQFRDLPPPRQEMPPPFYGPPGAQPTLRDTRPRSHAQPTSPATPPEHRPAPFEPPTDPAMPVPRRADGTPVAWDRRPDLGERPTDEVTRPQSPAPPWTVARAAATQAAPLPPPPAPPQARPPLPAPPQARPPQIAPPQARPPQPAPPQAHPPLPAPPQARPPHALPPRADSPGAGPWQAAPPAAMPRDVDRPAAPRSAPPAAPWSAPHESRPEADRRAAADMTPPVSPPSPAHGGRTRWPDGPDTARLATPAAPLEDTQRVLLPDGDTDHAAEASVDVAVDGPPAEQRPEAIAVEPVTAPPAVQEPATTPDDDEPASAAVSGPPAVDATPIEVPDRAAAGTGTPDASHLAPRHVTPAEPPEPAGAQVEPAAAAPGDLAIEPAATSVPDDGEAHVAEQPDGGEHGLGWLLNLSGLGAVTTAPVEPEPEPAAPVVAEPSAATPVSGAPKKQNWFAPVDPEDDSDEETAASEAADSTPEPEAEEAEPAPVVADDVPPAEAPDQPAETAEEPIEAEAEAPEAETPAGPEMPDAAAEAEPEPTPEPEPEPTPEPEPAPEAEPQTQPEALEPELETQPEALEREPEPAEDQPEAPEAEPEAPHAEPESAAATMAEEPAEQATPSAGEARPEPAPVQPEPAPPTAFARQPRYGSDRNPRRLADPEQVLAAYPWRFSPDTLRELIEDPEELLIVRDRLTDKLEYAERDAVRARLLSLRAVVSRVLGDLDLAVADGREALAHAEATGELRRTSIVQARLAHVLQWLGEFAEADRLFEVANSPELPDRLRAEMFELAGRSAFEQGRHLEAMNRFEQALDVRRGEDPDLVARIESALDAVQLRVRAGGWGPYPRSHSELLQERAAPRPLRDERTGLWGYVGALAPQFAEAQPFREGLAWVRRPQSRAWELIDDSGRPVVDERSGYLMAHAYSDGLAWVSRDEVGGWFGVDRAGRVVVPGGFDEVRPFRRGVAPVRRGGWGAIDRHGRVVVPPKYRGFVTILAGGRRMDGFTDEGLAVVDAGDRLGVVDRAGQLLVAPVHARLVIHPVAFLIGDRNGRWGALDRAGEPLIDVVHRTEADVADAIDALLSDTRPVL